MREPLINNILVIRLTILAVFVSVVALVIPYPQDRVDVADPQLNTTQAPERDSNS